MTPRARRIVLLLLAAALVALLLLSMSLTDLQLQAGSPFAGAAGNAAAPGKSSQTSADSQGSFAVVEAVLGVILLVFLVYLPSRLARLLSLRNILWLVVGFFLLVGLVSILPRVLPGAAVAAPTEVPIAATPPSFDYPLSPLGEPPAPFQWLTVAGLLAGFALLIVLLARQASRPGHAAQAVGQEADKALRDLRAGQAFRDVIIRCYLQMTDVLRKEQHIERRESMTAREFQDWLEARGIPAAPIQRLTALFETVRYGNGGLARHDEESGVECLQQIVQYCRAGSGAK